MEHPLTNSKNLHMIAKWFVRKVFKAGNSSIVASFSATFVVTWSLKFPPFTLTSPVDPSHSLAIWERLNMRTVYRLNFADTSLLISTTTYRSGNDFHATCLGTHSVFIKIMLFHNSAVKEIRWTAQKSSRLVKYLAIRHYHSFLS